jgi:hypothetical protein
MKSLTTMLAFAAMLLSLTGCCCWNPCGYGYGFGSPCGPSGCSPYGAPAMQPTTTYQGYDALTGLPISTTAYQPVVTAPAVSLGPLEALPTYR